jgi:hypothetical protein
MEETFMASAQKTTDHRRIRQWVEERGGHPAAVRSTERGGDVGLLRIDFPDYGDDSALEEISWDDFFDKFEEKQLAFLYQDKDSDGKQSRFNKLVSRGD